MVVFSFFFLSIEVRVHFHPLITQIHPLKNQYTQKETTEEYQNTTVPIVVTTGA